MTWKVIVHKDHARWETTDLMIVELDGQNAERRAYLPMTSEKITSRHAVMQPTLRIDDDSMAELLQAFADAAWEHGIRPRQIEDQRSQVIAMESHLADLRRIAFKALKID